MLKKFQKFLSKDKYLKKIDVPKKWGSIKKTHFRSPRTPKYKVS